MPARPASPAERQVLFDAINVSWTEDAGSSQCPPPFGILALQQMPPTRAAEQDFSAAGDFETFAYGFPGLDTLGTSHIGSFFYGA